VSCVTFAISWRIAYLRLLMVFMGYLKARVFTHTLPDINSLKNAIRQETVNVTQDTLRRVMASVPGRWQQCLHCHGGHLQDVVLKTWGFLWIQDTDLLDRVQLYLLLCTINVLAYFQNAAPCIFHYSVSLELLKVVVFIILMYTVSLNST